jgi:hypothetical protein
MSGGGLEAAILGLQCYDSAQAGALILQFDAGTNPQGNFLFHFTTSDGERGIFGTHEIRANTWGFLGPGVYALRTPKPSRWLLWLVGIPRSRTRVPIAPHAHAGYARRECGWMVLLRTPGHGLSLVCRQPRTRPGSAGALPPGSTESRGEQ